MMNDDKIDPLEDNAKSEQRIPDWHAEILAERLAAVREGRTTFEDWEVVKERLRKRLEGKRGF